MFFAWARIPGSRISSTLRGVEFDIGASELCHLLSIPNTGARVFESKTWPQVDGFDPGVVVCRLTGSIAHRVGLLQANNLTHEVRLLHQIIGCCILPRGGHWNEVSYLDSFLLDSILVRRPVDLGHLMIRHMISSHSVAGRVLPYGRLFTRLFRFHGLDLTNQTNQQAPRHYDTFTASTLGRMRIPTLKAPLTTQPEEDEIRGMEAGVDPPD